MRVARADSMLLHRASFLLVLETAQQEDSRRPHTALTGRHRQYECKEVMKSKIQGLKASGYHAAGDKDDSVPLHGC